MENSLRRRMTALTFALGVPSLIVLGGATSTTQSLSEMLKNADSTVQSPDPHTYLAINK